ncbi:MAG: hypothetical protein JW751_22280 [Polyangiaceae bacterium]|nr:hypothetical protein [Polyangiaceae bacterium]
MATLREKLSTGTKRQAVVDDALLVLDQEVADKSGLTGIAIKAAYAMVKGVKPGFIREVVDHLLDDFVDALEPIAAEAAEKGQRAGPYLETNRSRVADALLAITDRKAQNAQNRAIKAAYERLRPTAKKHVEAAAPRLGRMMEKHLAD